ncbi:MAG: pyridoxamine 5'-phosphate oxidase family protein [Novosphingobium sp.]|nr:pyridoxamine 5'-phosphate oxidase family protein [Novosphingobium sp.]
MDKELREEFWQSFEKSPFCMVRLENAGGHAEPMTAQLDRDAHHEFWFFTSRDNRIAAGGKAMVQVVTKGHDVFGCLLGTLVEETDKSIWDKQWSRQAEAWFPEGRSDPKVIMLRFDIESAEVWTADASIVGKFKLLTGKEIDPEEAGEHAVGLV